MGKSLDSLLIIGFLVILFVSIIQYLPSIRKLIGLVINAF